jgi:multidrug efflux system membrane fusion protein
MRRLLPLLALSLLAGAMWLAYDKHPGVHQWVDARLGAAPSTPVAKAIPAAPVRTAEVRRRTVPIVLEGVGNVQSRSTIAIKSRIDGQLMEALVSEGQAVRQGDLLFRLDARPFEAQLRQAEANVARDRANLAKAFADEKRYESLAQKGVSPRTKLEEAETSVAALQAAIRASEATVEIARLNLEYASIRAPIDGRVGSMLLTPGNMVKANDTQAIMMLTAIKPINVAFALPEQHVGELRERLKSAEPLIVEAIVQGDEAAHETGELFFINNTVDPTTGTITVMARFTNEEERLVPGQFVRARVQMTTLPDAVVVPSKGLQINQRGHYVWVAKPDHTAEMRPVTIGPETDGETVVSRGLAAGDRIVVDGQLRLFPGARIKPLDPSPQSAKSAKSDS